MPSTLPPSTTGITATTTAAAETPTNPNPNTPNNNSNSNNNTDPQTQTQTNKPRYVVSASGGHAAHPDDIIASCQALHAHVTQLQAQAQRDLQALTERIKARELAEKRRVAPGWLDSEARLLEPERAAGSSLTGGGEGGGDGNGNGHGSGNGSGGLGMEVEMGCGQGAEMLLQQPVRGYEAAGGGRGYGDGYGNGTGYGHGAGGVSEMAVPDEGEQLDRVFGSLQLGKQ